MPYTGSRPALRRRALTPALCSVQFVDVMCVTIVVTALPDMVTDFGGAAAASTVIAAAYATAFGGLLLLGARVGQRVGHRRSILASIAVFAVGALVAAVAPSALVLAAARALQGAAAACAVPSALTLLTMHAPDAAARARAIALWSAAGAAAGIAGYLVGGTVAQFGGWRLIFWLLLLVSLLLAIGVRATVPADPPGRAKPALDLAAAAAVTGAVMFLVVAASLAERGGYRGAILLGGAVVSGALFLVTNRRSASPLIPAALAPLPAVRWGAATAFANTATTSGAVTVLTLHLQESRGYSPAAAAAMLLPLSVLVIAGSAAAGRLDRLLGTATVGAIGLLVVAAGITGLALRPEAGLLVATATAVTGLGLGMSSVASTATALAVPEELRATASGLVNTAAQLGTALGTAALLLLAATGGSTPRPAWVAAAAAAAVTAVSWWLATMRRQGGDAT